MTGVGVLPVFRAEWRKLNAQLVTRLLVVVCVLGPLAYAVVLKTQSGTPTDALLGVWAQQSGFSLALVMLVFAGTWAFPILAGLLAGDSFASEDRLGTWPTVLTRSCSRGELFTAKVLAVSAAACGLVTLFAASTIVFAVALVGTHDLVGVGGNVIGPGRAALLVTAAWLWSLLPVLAFVSLGVLFSVATKSGIAGVAGPVLVALAMQLLFLVGSGEGVHLALVGSGFDAWHAFLGRHIYVKQLTIATIVCLVWTAVCVSAAWWLLRRREFTGAPDARSTNWLRVGQVVAAFVVVVALLTAGGRWGPSTVTAGRLEDSIAATFSRLTIYQQRLLGRDVPWNADISVLAKCIRRGQASRGAGDNWNCSLTLFTLAAQGQGLQQIPITYEVSAKSDGCYRAESPPTFIGGRTLREPDGHSVVNPLFVFYGCFEPV